MKLTSKREGMVLTQQHTGQAIGLYALRAAGADANGGMSPKPRLETDHTQN